MYTYLFVGAFAVVSPNGGETLVAGTTVPITWTSLPNAVSFRVKYSIDNGATWILITNVENVNSTNWTVPTGLSGPALVKVAAFDGAGQTGTWLGHVPSDSAFTIVEPVQVTSPNGGETLVAGNIVPIEWNAPPVSVSFRVKYSIDNGATWVLIAEVEDVNTVDWPVPLGLSGPALVKVAAFDGAGQTGTWLGHDPSDAAFRIIVGPVQVTSPNGGETLVSGTSVPISWAAGTNAVSFRVKYSIDNGATWILIAEVENVGTVDWPVPIGLSGPTLVKVSAFDGAGQTGTWLGHDP
jgi:hypothetical protein